MTRDEIERLAHAINQLRPDWPIASLRTGITRDLGTRAYRDAAIALTWVACDPTSRTPARVLEAGPWWLATQVDTSDADRHPSSVAPNEMCQTCGRSRTHCQESVRAHGDAHTFRPLTTAHGWSPSEPTVPNPVIRQQIREALRKGREIEEERVEQLRERAEEIA